MEWHSTVIINCGTSSLPAMYSRAETEWLALLRQVLVPYMKILHYFVQSIASLHKVTCIVTPSQVVRQNSHSYTVLWVRLSQNIWIRLPAKLGADRAFPDQTGLSVHTMGWLVIVGPCGVDEFWIIISLYWLLSMNCRCTFNHLFLPENSLRVFLKYC